LVAVSVVHVLVVVEVSLQWLVHEWPHPGLLVSVQVRRGTWLLHVVVGEL
jgi:hypothetical protein